MPIRHLASRDVGVLAGIAGALADHAGLIASVVALVLSADLLQAKSVGVKSGQIRGELTVSTEVAQVSEMVAVSPRLELMPASWLPEEALTFEMTTWRSPCSSQLPQERYNLPKSETWKPSMVTVPTPLCWMTLSLAP